MSKGLEALDVFRGYVSDFYEVKCFETVEKDLKALEIIRNKKCLVEDILDVCIVNKEEYDLLKEVLLWN